MKDLEERAREQARKSFPIIMAKLTSNTGIDELAWVLAAFAREAVEAERDRWREPGTDAFRCCYCDEIVLRRDLADGYGISAVCKPCDRRRSPQKDQPKPPSRRQKG